MPTILIAGGLDRGHSFEELRPYMGNVKAVVAVGETARRFSEFAASCGVEIIITAEDMKDAVRKAYPLTEAGDIILLSPACASWDHTRVLKYRRAPTNLIEAVHVHFNIVNTDTCGRMRSLEAKLKTSFIVSAVALSFIGLAFVHSAGSYWGAVHYADSSPFIVKQAIYMAVSIGIALVIMKSPLTSSPKTWTFVYWMTILLLVAVLIPGIGAVRNGSQSWIALGPFSIQPAEFVKVALIGKLACSMDKIQGKRYFSV